MITLIYLGLLIPAVAAGVLAGLLTREGGTDYTERSLKRFAGTTAATWTALALLVWVLS